MSVSTHRAIEEAKKSPSAFVASLLAEAVMPSTEMDFPLQNKDGKPVARVKLVLLAQGEEDLAFANARKYVGRVTSGEENVDWKPEEIEHNARASEILAIACRKVDGSAFFEHGVIDTRCFPTDVLGPLMLAYANLKEDAWPALKTIDDREVDALITIIAEGALDYPFALFSRTKLETFCDLLVKRSVDEKAASPNEMGSSISGSSEPGAS